MILLLLSFALAQSPVHVDLGSRVIVPFTGYLVPEQMMRDAVASGEALEVCKQSLVTTADQCSIAMQNDLDAMKGLTDQLEKDKIREEWLAIQLNAEKDATKKARRQRNTAVLVAGGLLVGAVTTFAVAI